MLQSKVTQFDKYDNKCCPVCFERYDQDKQRAMSPSHSNSGVNCNHTLCMSCWIKIASSSNKLCPLCLRDVEEWVCGLKKEGSIKKVLTKYLHRG